MSPKYTFAELFAGIGGFHQGMEGLAECVFASEIDEYALETYEYNFPDVADRMRDHRLVIGDIHSYYPYNGLPDFDILTAGFPCQPYSRIGNRKGLADDRGLPIFNAILNVIEAKRPKAIILENVFNILNLDANGVNTVDEIQKSLEDLNYTFDMKNLSASEFGLPQRRARVYMVGFDKEILPEGGEWTGFDFPEPTTPKGYAGERTLMKDILGVGWCNKDIGYTIRVKGGYTKIGSRHNWDSYYVAENESAEKSVVRIRSQHAEKMMGFLDSFEFPGSISETRRMYLLGNTVAVPVIKAVAEKVVEKLDTLLPE